MTRPFTTPWRSICCPSASGSGSPWAPSRTSSCGTRSGSRGLSSRRWTCRRPSPVALMHWSWEQFNRLKKHHILILNRIYLWDKLCTDFLMLYFHDDFHQFISLLNRAPVLCVVLWNKSRFRIRSCLRECWDCTSHDSGQTRRCSQLCLDAAHECIDERACRDNSTESGAWFNTLKNTITKNITGLSPYSDTQNCWKS